MPKLISSEIISNIIQLRKRGFSLTELKSKFPNVGYGTIFRYIKDVDILPEFKALWLSKRNGSVRRMNKNLQVAEEKAKNILENLSDKEKLLFLAGIYWAEGSKAELCFTNTDPEMVKLYVKGLTNYLGISKDRIKPSIRIFEDLNARKCLNYWSKTTGIPKSQFKGITVLSGKKVGKHEYGMCRIRVEKGGDMLKCLVALRKRVSLLY